MHVAGAYMNSFFDNTMIEEEWETDSEDETEQSFPGPKQERKVCYFKSEMSRKQCKCFGIEMYII